MKKIKKGTKFVVCSHGELKKKGWFQKYSAVDSSYRHITYEGLITWRMINDFQGETLTVLDSTSTFPNSLLGWYTVDENSYHWPAQIFLFQDQEQDHTCEEGMTPIDGWFICKNCGDNLREIK